MGGVAGREALYLFTWRITFIPRITLCPSVYPPPPLPLRWTRGLFVYSPYGLARVVT